MRRTAIYLRVSTVGQVQEGDSLAAQRNALKEYIDKHDDLTLAGEYVDEGISGQKFEQRDELQRLLADVKDGKIDLILVTKLDRFFRSVRHYAATQEILDRYHVQWLAIWEPIYNTETPAGQLIINQMMSFAQFEAQNAGNRVKQVLAYKVQQGEVASGNVPPGYSIVDKKLVPNEDAKNVQEAFRFFAMTGSINQAIRKYSGLSGIPGTYQGFKYMLKNKTYIGEHRGNPTFCQPIIDRALFDDVQRKIGINIKVSQKRTYLFSGLMVCSECGHKMNASGKHQKLKGDRKTTYKIYRCYLKYNSPVSRCSNPVTLRERKIERYLLDHIKDEIRQYVFQCQQAAAPVKDNRNRIATLEKKLDRLKALYLDEVIGLDEYKTDRQKLLEDIEELEKEAPEERNVVDVSHLEELLNTDIEAIYTGMTDEQKRFFWRSIIREIRVGSDRVLHVYF